MFRLFWHLLSFPFAIGFFGIGMGPSSEEKSQYNNLNSQNQFATGLGESDISQSSAFMSAILSGDPTKTAQALAPQISGIQQRAGQEKKTIAEFGNRGGGTNAKAAGIDTAASGAVTNLVGGATADAAKGLASLGTSLFGAGQSGTQAAFGEAKTLHDQTEAMFNDIFKSSAQVAGAVAGGFGGGGELPGGTPGFTSPVDSSGGTTWGGTGESGDVFGGS